KKKKRLSGWRRDPSGVRAFAISPSSGCTLSSIPSVSVPARPFLLPFSGCSRVTSERHPPLARERGQRKESVEAAGVIVQSTTPRGMQCGACAVFSRKRRLREPAPYCEAGFSVFRVDLVLTNQVT